MEIKTENNNHGIGFSGALALIFIVLKLTKVITWSWVWVLSPIWIPFTLVVILTIIMAFLKIILDK